MAAGNNIFVLRDLFIGMLGREVGGAGEIFVEEMRGPARTAVFDIGADGGRRRYCRKSEGAVTCIFGFSGRVG